LALEKADLINRRKAIASKAIKSFRDGGYYAPLRIYERTKADDLYRAYTQFQDSAVEIFGQEQRFKTHLLAGWLADVVRNPRMLDVVEDLIGPNILCWSTGFFGKAANSEGRVGYHQDACVNFVEPNDDVIHVWLALRPTTTDNGCLRVLPRSHLGDVIPISPSGGGKEMLRTGTLTETGWQAALDKDEHEFVDLVLDAGEASLHHHCTVHGSGPNRSGFHRLGVSITYMTTAAHNPKFAVDSATLVRGKDDYGHFELEPAPDADFSSAAIAAFQRATTTPGGEGVGAEAVQ
jgi:non-heme Fe2+,alpha-ketoglutarate-dependent halogenase